MIADETRKDVKEQVSKLIDKQDESFKFLLNVPKESNQNEMIMALFPKLIENPTLLQSIIEFSKIK